MSIIGLRAFFAAIVFAIYRRSVKVAFTRGNLMAAACLAATTILFVFSNKLTTAAAAILLQFTAPIFIILIQLALYRQRPKVGELAAVSATLIGMLLLFADRLEAGHMLGNLCGVASGLCFAGVFICYKMPDVDTEQSLYMGFLINAVIGMPFAFFSATAEPAAWAAASFLGIVQVGIAYILFSKGIKKTPALLACLITALEPVLNPLWVAVVTGEVPGPFSILGGAVIIFAVLSYNIWLEKRG
jgi:drug/metabolite transporter (DMT)-like permease